MRYEVDIVLTQHHSFAVDAKEPNEAWLTAMGKLGTRIAEHTEVRITTNQGVNSDPKGTQ